nr:hypothetical protein GCM10020092_016970 [Actinoplanes digitatis]
MVEVQVAVDHVPYVTDRGAGRGERRRHRDAVRPVVRVHLGTGTHAGVDEQQAVRVVDEIAEARLDAGRTRAGLGGGPDEVAEVDPAHAGVRHE